MHLSEEFNLQVWFDAYEGRHEKCEGLVWTPLTTKVESKYVWSATHSHVSVTPVVICASLSATESQNECKVTDNKVIYVLCRKSWCPVCVYVCVRGTEWPLTMSAFSVQADKKRWSHRLFFYLKNKVEIPTETLSAWALGLVSAELCPEAGEDRGLTRTAPGTQPFFFLKQDLVRTGT